MDIVWRLGGLADGAPGLSVDGMIGWRVDGLTGRMVDGLTCRRVDGLTCRRADGLTCRRVDELTGKRVDALIGKLTCRLAVRELDGGLACGVCVGLAGGWSLIFCSFPHILYIRQHILSLTFISLYIRSLLTESFSLLSHFKEGCLPAV